MEENNKNIEKTKIDKNFVSSIAMYSSASIVGPLIFFGGIGFWLDKKFSTSPTLFLIGMGIAFVFTNVFLLRKAFRLNKEIAAHLPVKPPLPKKDDVEEDFQKALAEGDKKKKQAENKPKPYPWN